MHHFDNIPFFKILFILITEAAPTMHRANRRNLARKVLRSFDFCWGGFYYRPEIAIRIDGKDNGSVNVYKWIDKSWEEVGWRCSYRTFIDNFNGPICPKTLLFRNTDVLFKNGEHVSTEVRGKMPLWGQIEEGKLLQCSILDTNDNTDLVKLLDDAWVLAWSPYVRNAEE